jgi:hypothetical protein
MGLRNLDPSGFSGERTIDLNIGWLYFDDGPRLASLLPKDEREAFIRNWRKELEDGAKQTYLDSIANLEKLLSLCCCEMKIQEACSVKVTRRFRPKPIPYNGKSTDWTDAPDYLKDAKDNKLGSITVLIGANLNLTGKLANAAGYAGSGGGIVILGGSHSGEGDDYDTLAHELGHKAGWVADPGDEYVNEDALGRRKLEDTHSNTPENLMAAGLIKGRQTTPDSQWCRRMAEMAK